LVLSRVGKYNHVPGASEAVGDSLFASRPPPTTPSADHHRRISREHPTEYLAVPATDAEPDVDIDTGFIGHAPVSFDNRCIVRRTLDGRGRRNHPRDEQNRTTDIQPA
jgi:hypothetical protein